MVTTQGMDHLDAAYQGRFCQGAGSRREGKSDRRHVGTEFSIRGRAQPELSRQLLRRAPRDGGTHPRPAPCCSGSQLTAAWAAGSQSSVGWGAWRITVRSAVLLTHQRTSLGAPSPSSSISEMGLPTPPHSSLPFLPRWRFTNSASSAAHCTIPSSHL